jgi:hypothetical protein
MECKLTLLYKSLLKLWNVLGIIGGKIQYLWYKYHQGYFSLKENSMNIFMHLCILYTHICAPMTACEYVYMCIYVCVYVWIYVCVCAIIRHFYERQKENDPGWW